MPIRWFYQLDSVEQGPLSESALWKLVKDGAVRASDLVRSDADPQWRIFADVFPQASPSVREPVEITDLSELSFNFEDSVPNSEATVHKNDGMSDAAVHPSIPVIENADIPMYYCECVGQTLGPMSIDELIVLADSGQLLSDDRVRIGDDAPWQPAGGISELAEMLKRASEEKLLMAARPSATTRRLFQTAGKAKSAAESKADSAASVQPTPDSEVSETKTETDPSSAPKSTGKGKKSDLEKTHSRDEESGRREKNTQVSATETNSPTESTETGEPPEKSKPDKPMRRSGKKAAARRAAAAARRSKQNARDEKVLGDIFDTVFTADEKAPRSGLPPASSSETTPVVGDASQSTPQSAETRSAAGEKPM